MTTSPRSPAGHEFAAVDIRPEPCSWHLTCNGALPGMLLDYTRADFYLRHYAAAGSLASGYSWTAGSTQDPRLPLRDFEVRPLTQDETDAWKREYEPTTPA